jgi:hypothetical protein
MEKKFACLKCPCGSEFGTRNIRSSSSTRALWFGCIDFILRIKWQFVGYPYKYTLMCMMLHFLAYDFISPSFAQHLFGPPLSILLLINFILFLLKTNITNKILYSIFKTVKTRFNERDSNFELVMNKLESDDVLLDIIELTQLITRLVSELSPDFTLFPLFPSSLSVSPNTTSELTRENDDNNIAEMEDAPANTGNDTVHLELPDDTGAHNTIRSNNFSSGLPGYVIVRRPRIIDNDMGE